MAEYTSLAMSLMICALNDIKHISVRTDSELLSHQVTGMKQVMNVRLVHMVPIVHDLIKHFQVVQMMCIPRSQNAEADLVAKHACKFVVGKTFIQPDLFKITF